MPLVRVARTGRTRLTTSSRRRWIARRRNPLMVAAGGLGGLALLVRDGPSAVYVITVLALVAAAVGLIAALSSKAGDPVAEELDADHHEDHGHDRAVVGTHP